jgi:hypothetical protein
LNTREYEQGQENVVTKFEHGVVSERSASVSSAF